MSTAPRVRNRSSGREWTEDLLVCQYSLPRRIPLRSPLVSRHRSDVVGCAQPSERSARRIAQPIP
ncbi:hypothetical protein ET532_023985, partial [Verminephrobacter sp. Larva24]